MSITNPFMEFLGVREINAADGSGATHYAIDFSEEHMGNPLIRTFHGGILASFGETAAAMHLARERRASTSTASAVEAEKELPACATMTFDYLRPAFAKTLVGIPHTVRAGRRITTVSVQLRQDDQLVCIGRFLFPVGRN